MNGRFLSVGVGTEGAGPVGKGCEADRNRGCEADRNRGDGVDQNRGMESIGTEGSVLNEKTDGLREEEVSTARVDLRFRIFFQNPAHVGKADSSSLSLAGITGFKQGICQ